MSTSCVVPPVKVEGLTYEPDEIILYGMNLVHLLEDFNLRFATIRANVKASEGGQVPWDIYILAGEPRPDSSDARTKLEINAFLLKQAPFQEKKRFATVYGYAYEGFCYRLDKPKILAFESNYEPESAVGCGFDGPKLNYYMWRVRASDTLVEMTINSDTFQKLILEQNLPGKRSPNTYAANMIQSTGLVHRGGRFGEP